MSDRIELESQLAMLERTVETLSGEMAEQGRRIAALQDHVAALVEQLKRLRGGAEPFEPHDTRPPHWGG